MADLKAVLKHYQQLGWLDVPGLHDPKGRRNSCKICNWYNDHDGERECPTCCYHKSNDGKAKKMIHGVDVRKLEFKEYQVFQVIARQILHGETPFVTVEEFAEECEKRIARTEENEKTQKTEQQEIDEILYQ